MSAAKYKYLTVLLVLALVVAAVVLFSILVPMRGMICTRNEFTGQANCGSYPIALVVIWNAMKSVNDFGVAIAAIASIFIAWFAFALLRSTEALRAATEKSWSLSKEQATVASRALVELERPWVFVDISPWIHASDGHYSVPHVRFTVVNYGRAPAIVQLMDAAFSTGLRPAVKLRDYDHLSGTALGEGREWKDCVATLDEELRHRLRQEGPHMVPTFEDENLFFTVRVEYTDAPGNPHVSRFGWRFDPAAGRWIGLRDPDWFFAD